MFWRWAGFARTLVEEPQAPFKAAMTSPNVAAVPASSQLGLEGPARFNPFAQRIRPTLSESEVMDGVARAPHFNPAELALPANRRRELVLRLDDFVEPLPRFFDLESRMSAMIRSGYERRNPLPLAVQRQLAEAQGLDPRDYVTRTPITLASGLSLIGFSGVGKTTAVSSVLHLHEQLHLHTSFQGIAFKRTQLTWVRVACPPTGGPRALLMNIFQELDRLLGSDYYRRYETSRRSAAELIPNLVELMSTLGLGLLVIDEIQRLVRMGPDEAQLLLDVFTHLRTESHTPVMLIGTPKAMKVLDSSFEQGRRNTSVGHIHWQMMDNDETWDYFVEQMWKLQWLSSPTPLSIDLKNALYECSQGITDLAVKIFKMAQFTIIGMEDEVLTPALLGAVVQSEFPWFVPWIPYLRRRDPKLMEGDFDQLFEPAKKGKGKSAPRTSLADALLGAGVPPERLNDVLSGIEQQRQDRPAGKSEAPAKKPGKKQTSPPKRTGETLWEIVHSSPRPGHDVLLDAGHVRLPDAVGC